MFILLFASADAGFPAGFIPQERRRAPWKDDLMGNSRPNIVIVMTDQQRAGLCRREGFALDTTPFLDQLAAGGAWFNRAYTTMPACAPARVSMLTGRYPSATRVRTNHNIADAFYSRDMFELFREAGYATGLCGKNHSHLSSQRADFWCEFGHLGGPADTDGGRAFDAFLERTHFHMHPEATPFPLECQLPHRIVSRAAQWLDTVRDRPFLVWLSFPEPHNPYQVPEPYYSMFPPEALPPTAAGAEAVAAKGLPYEWCRDSFEAAFPDFAPTLPRARANYMGMLRLIDDQLNRFAGYLERRGLRENTLLVFLSDHGDFAGEYGLMRKGPEMPEALIRIPLIFNGPGIPAHRAALPSRVSIADLLPTLCEAAGIAVPDGVQGRSFWRVLTGEEDPEARFGSAFAEQGFGGLPYDGSEELDAGQDGFEPSPDGEQWGAFDCLNSRTQSGCMRMVRKGDWKLVRDAAGRAWLHHLGDDPAEVRNLHCVPEHRAVEEELTEQMLGWLLRLEDPLPHPRTRYVVKRPGAK